MPHLTSIRMNTSHLEEKPKKRYWSSRLNVTFDYKTVVRHPGNVTGELKHKADCKVTFFVPTPPRCVATPCVYGRDGGIFDLSTSGRKLALLSAHVWWMGRDSFKI